MMSKFLAFFLAFLSFCAFGQKKEKNTLLYSVKGPGTKTSYLFGTTHLIADTAFYFPQKLEKTIENSEVMVLEIDNLGDASIVSKLMLESGSSFDIFTKEQADSVIRWGSETLKMQPEAFRSAFGGMKPFALMQVSLQAPKVPVKMYEIELMSRANKYHLPIKGLETIDYQLSLFDQMPDSVLAEMIMDPIRHPGKADEVMSRLTQLYVNKDVEGLHKLVTEAGEAGLDGETLIYRRNRNWVPKMSELMKQNTCFFAVGAGHLGGQSGLIQLLRNEGYTVTPVYY